MRVAIIDYNAGNVCSVVNALTRLGVESEITSNVNRLLSADKIIFPGVGEAATTMDYLRKSGLDKIIKELRQPFLGICLGMQLMCKHSEEGDVDCLGLFDVEVKRFVPKKHEDKVPHIGWNTLTNYRSNLFLGFEKSEYVYFVHSYYVPVCNDTIADCQYIVPFSAALNKGNFYATQFHPEKSGKMGEHILSNFLSL